MGVEDEHARFDGSIPAAYDRYLGPVLFEPFASDLAARLAVPEDARVLEIACGTGVLTRAVRDALGAPARVVATDLNEPMLRFARAKLGDRVSWAGADASALPFAAATFDAVVCQFGLMFVPDVARAVEEARRVLRSGGTFLFNVWGAIEANPLQYAAHVTAARLFPDDPPRFYEVPFTMARTDAVAATLRAAGFVDVAVDEVRAVAECPSAREVAVGLVYGNPIVAAIRARGTVDVGSVVDAVAAAVEGACGAAPVRGALMAAVMSARAG